MNYYTAGKETQGDQYRVLQQSRPAMNQHLLA
jgi:hypothetical protein